MMSKETITTELKRNLDLYKEVKYAKDVRIAYKTKDGTWKRLVVPEHVLGNLVDISCAVVGWRLNVLINQLGAKIVDEAIEEVVAELKK